MKRIGAYEAKTHLPKILRQVLAGETFVVTRNGEPIAQISPVHERTEMDPKRLMAELRDLDLDLGTTEDIQSMRDEGRRI